MPLYVQGSPVAPLTALSKGNIGYSFGALGAAAIAASPGGLSRTANVVTVTTSAAHKFFAGQMATLLATTSVGGTNFDGNYIIQSITSATVFVAIPIDPTRLHQANDTGGVGTATSVQGENFVNGTGGQAFALSAAPKTDNPLSLAGDLIFSAAPGVFEFDVQAAQVDAPGNYQTIQNGSVTAVDAANFTAHIDVTTNARFVRWFLKTLTNAVNVLGSLNR